jgi:pyruvate dehydrogenase E1 component beta subunit
MYSKIKGPVPEEEYTIPFGKADVKREGKDVSLIAISRMVHTTLAAAEKLAAEGISAEVIDPRTLTPLDEATLIKSVAKTGGAVIIDEGYNHFGTTAELAATIAYGAFDFLDAPIERLGAMDVPIPFSPQLEFATIPDEAAIILAVHRILDGRRH